MQDPFIASDLLASTPYASYSIELVLGFSLQAEFLAILPHFITAPERHKKELSVETAPSYVRYNVNTLFPSIY